MLRSIIKNIKLNGSIIITNFKAAFTKCDECHHLGVVPKLTHINKDGYWESVLICYKCGNQNG